MDFETTVEMTDDQLATAISDHHDRINKLTDELHEAETDLSYLAVEQSQRDEDKDESKSDDETNEGNSQDLQGVQFEIEALARDSSEALARDSSEALARDSSEAELAAA